MTIGELLTMVDALKPNDYSASEKKRFVRVMEGRIIAEVLSSFHKEDFERITAYRYRGCVPMDESPEDGPFLVGDFWTEYPTIPGYTPEPGYIPGVSIVYVTSVDAQTGQPVTNSAKDLQGLTGVWMASNDNPLLLPEPWTEMYRHYVEGQIAFCQEEFDRYQNSVLQWTELFDGYKRYCMRTCRPKTKEFVYT